MTNHEIFKISKVHKRHTDMYDLLLSIHKYFDDNNNSTSHEGIIEIFLYTYRFRKARPI